MLGGGKESILTSESLPRLASINRQLRIHAKLLQGKGQDEGTQRLIRNGNEQFFLGLEGVLLKCGAGKSSGSSIVERARGEVEKLSRKGFFICGLRINDGFFELDSIDVRSGIQGVIVLDELLKEEDVDQALKEGAFDQNFLLTEDINQLFADATKEQHEEMNVDGDGRFFVGVVKVKGEYVAVFKKVANVQTLIDQKAPSAPAGYVYVTHETISVYRDYLENHNLASKEALKGLQELNKVVAGSR